MDPVARDLAVEIIRCPVIADAVRGERTTCDKVISWYGTAPGRRYYPEPWVGHLTQARILFLASNPGAAARGAVPGPDESLTSETPDIEDILTWQDGGFDDGRRPGIAHGTVMVNRAGKETGSVRYWVWAKRMASELLGQAARPGLDYAMTEVVHCGSQGEYGTWDAAPACADRYLNRVLHVSPARVLVAAGAVAQWAVKDRLRVDTGVTRWAKTEAAGKMRLVLALPHPNARGTRWGLEPYFTNDEIADFRTWASSEPPESS